MGIRIHKAMGYGLDDVKPDDPRINWEAVNSSLLYDATWSDFVVYAQNIFPKSWKTSFLTAKGLSLGSTEPYQHLHYDDEGRGNCLLVVPPGQSHWFRYDDDIDYQEAGRGSQGNTVVRHPYGFYPWNASYQNGKGKSVNTSYAIEFMRKDQPWTFKRELALKMGFSSLAQARRHLSPFIPESVALFAAWADVFTKLTTIYKLKPIIYTYWR